MRRFNLKPDLDFYDWILETGFSGRAEIKKSSWIFYRDNGIMYTSRTKGEFSAKDLNIFKETKKQALKWVAENGEMYYPENKPLFFSFSGMVDTLEIGADFDALEVDIRGAYWNIARELRIIDQELYEKGMQHKKARNAAIGALAAITDSYTVENGVLSQHRELRPPTYSIQRRICAECDAVMLDLINTYGTYFIFYWVDGAYFQYFQGDLHPDMLKLDQVKNELGLTFKVNRVKIRKKEKVLSVLRPDSADWEDFYLPRARRKK